MTNNNPMPPEPVASDEDIRQVRACLLPVDHWPPQRWARFNSDRIERILNRLASAESRLAETQDKLERAKWLLRRVDYPASFVQTVRAFLFSLADGEGGEKTRAEAGNDHAQQ